MSELAFNLTGEPFDVPGTAVGWRVRRMKPRGAPEVVYSRDGGPLILPIDADIDDLRRAARSEGRYRLDPVDEHNRMIKDASAGYVCVHPGETSSDTGSQMSRSTSDNVAIEAMKLNTELAKTIVDRFPMMMEAAAVLLRAADGAGLPARLPRPVVEDDDADDADDDDDDDDQNDDDELGDESAAEPSAKPVLQTIVETLAPYVMPAIMGAIAGGKVKIPGGIAAFFDPRPSAKARATAAQRTTHETSTPGAVPAPGPRDPAPAAAGATAPHVAARRVVVPPDARVPAPAVPRPGMSRAATGSPARDPAPRDPAPKVVSTPTPATPAAGPRATTPTAPIASSSPSNSPTTDAAPLQTPGSPVSSSSVAGAGPQADSGIVASAGKLEPASKLEPEQAPLDETEAAAPPVTMTAEMAAAADALADALLADDASENTPASALGSAPVPAEELPTLDADALAHFAAIQGALTFREGMLARALAAELSPADVRTWLGQLLRLSVPEAVVRIRDVLRTNGSGDDTGGVP